MGRHRFEKGHLPRPWTSRVFAGFLSPNEAVFASAWSTCNELSDTVSLWAVWGEETAELPGTARSICCEPESSFTSSVWVAVWTGCERVTPPASTPDNHNSNIFVISAGQADLQARRLPESMPNVGPVAWVLGALSLPFGTTEAAQQRSRKTTALSSVRTIV